jgi:hypothetical protein
MTSVSSKKTKVIVENLTKMGVSMFDAVYT